MNWLTEVMANKVSKVNVKIKVMSKRTNELA